MVRPPHIARENGFSLVEVMVAMTLLLVSVLGLMAMADSSASTTTQTRAREGAVSLAREVLEQAGGIPFAQVDPTTLVSTLQQAPGLANTGGAGSWSVTRRDANGAGGFSYLLTATSCSMDDVADGYGARTGATFCAGAPAAGTADSQPEDFKRVTVTVSWTQRGQTKSLSQSQMFAKNGSPDLPVMNSLSLSSPVVTSPQSPIIGTNASTATFTSTATSTATSVVYSVDGVDIGNATKSGANWVFSLNIASWTDGGYAIGARAINAQGISGPTRTLTLTLARNAPAAPAGLLGGRNIVVKNGANTNVAEFDWLPNAERNVLGYRVYRPGGTLACPGSASTLDLASDCIDFSPVDGTYSVVAVYRDAGGTLRESAASTIVVVPLEPPYRSFYFKPTTANIATRCPSANGQRDAEDAFAGAASDSTFSFASSTQSVVFCTRLLTAADSSVAGATKAYAWATNGGGSGCTITATLGYNGGSTGLTATQTVPQNTGSPGTPLTWSFTTGAYTFATGDRVSIHFNTPNGASCNGTSLVFGGNVRRARLDLPKGGAGTPVGQPGAPTALQGTRATDNSVALSWTAPSTGGAVSFYRIYRDGLAYTDRYDRTGDTTTTYTDPNSDGGTHTYYVTAVSSALGESSILGPITR